MFIRSISTFQSLVLTTGVEGGKFIELAIRDLNERIYQLIKTEQQNAIMDEIIGLDESNKKAAETGDKQKSVAVSKKNKKKNKKAKEATDQIQVVDDVVIIDKSKSVNEVADNKAAPPPPDEADEPLAEGQTD